MRSVLMGLESIHQPIATESTIYQSPSPEDVFCFSPALAQTSTGRLIATCDLGGPGVGQIDDAVAIRGHPNTMILGKTLISDDLGESWRIGPNFPMRHARPIVIGDTIYILGHRGELGITRSDDDGETWSDVSVLDDEHAWHQAPCAYDIHNGRLCITMEIREPGKTWPGVAPVLMVADTGDNLCHRSNWSFSNPLAYTETMPATDALGIPYYPTGRVVPGRNSGDPCWLESHAIRVHDPRHLLYDPNDRTVYLWMRMHTGLTNIAAIARGVIDANKQPRLELVTTPAGATMALVPCPGGHMKFHIVYDTPSQLYWLLSTNATDSMTRPELLPDDRYSLPNNERNRLLLHYSTNLMDWQFAGVVATGPSAIHSRHYAHMIASSSRDELMILSRSGNQRAQSAHNGNLLTFHRISNFRSLVDSTIRR